MNKEVMIRARDLKKSFRNGEVEQVEMHTCIYLPATVQEFHGTDFTMNMVFYPMDDKREVNRLHIIEETKQACEHPVYIPYYVAEFGGSEDLCVARSDEKLF